MLADLVHGDWRVGIHALENLRLLVIATVATRAGCEVEMPTALYQLRARI